MEGLRVPGVNLGTVSMTKSLLCRLTSLFVAFFGLVILFAVVLRVSEEDDGHLDFQTLRDLSHRFRMSEFRTLRETFSQRNARLERRCEVYLKDENYSKEMRSVRPESFYYLKKPNLAVCMIPKVASTSMSRFILNAHQKFRPSKFSLSDKTSIMHW